MKKTRALDMINGSLLPKIILFSIPLMMSSILQLFFNAADIIVVGQYAGDTSLAAIGSTGSLVNLIINVFIGLSIGTNVVIAKYLGANNENKIKSCLQTSMSISVVFGVILTIIGLIVCKPLLQLMGSPDDVINLASLYLNIYFLGMPGLLVYNFGASILRAKGDTKNPLLFLTIAGVVNLVLNLISVIYFKMGVAGVAIATIISQYLCAYFVVSYLMNEQGALHLDITNFQIDKKILVEISKIGIPAGLQGTIFSLSNVVIQSSINSFGSSMMAGNAAAGNIEGFVYAGTNAFYQSCISFTAQNFGAKKKERILKILIICLSLTIFFGLLLGIGLGYFGEFFINIYNNDPQVISYGATRLRYIGYSYFLCGMMEVMVASLRGIGYSFMPMIVTLIGACGFRLLWIAIVFANFRYIEVVYLSYPISWALTTLFHIGCFFFVYKKTIKKL
ncbi:MAG: MATE family efflux transporter [Erysipelotrichaceae bacterium]